MAGRLLLVAVAISLAPRCAVQGKLRYCECLFQGNRYSADKEICVLEQDDDGQADCTSEMVPYISFNYTFYSSEPQRMFKYFPIQTTTHRALAICKQEGGTLASPINKDMFDHIAKTMRDQDAVEEWAFINYTDEKQEGVWLDFDGAPAPRLPWKKGMPDNWKNDENCLHFNYEDGVVNDMSCSDSYSFVCERRLRKKVPKGYVYRRYARTFFKLYKQEKPFESAKKTCKDDGAKLVVPEDWFKAREIISFMGYSQYPTDIYVDFTDEAEEGNFVTSEGRRMEDIEYRNWRKDEPDNGAPFKTPENCVTFNDRGYLADVPCTATQPFLCELVPF